MFLVKVPTQKAKFKKNLYINQISQTNFESFSNQRSDTALILSPLNFSPQFFFLFAFVSFYKTHIFTLSILFTSHLIRHSGTRRAFKGTQRALEHLRHLESTQKALGHQVTRALGGHSGTRRALGHLESTWALGHVKHLGIRTLRTLGHLVTWALKAFRHLGTHKIGHLEHLGTWALEALYLADSQ